MTKLLKLLLWLAMTSGGTPATTLTVTGVSPLSLVNAVAHSMVSLTQYGKCVQEAGASPSTPKGIYCNNGAIKYSANMANVNEQTALVGYYISAQGLVTDDPSNWIYQSYIPVRPNTTYTLSISQPVYYVTISEYSTAADSGFIIRKAGSSGGNTSLTITTEANTNYIRFGTNIDRTVVTLERVLAINWMLNEGDAAIPYAPYVVGGIYADGTPEVLTVSADGAETQTVTDIPMLLSVGDYKDEVELVNGPKTVRIGIKVLTGDNTKDGLWGTSAGASNLYSLTISDSSKDNTFSPISTHFVGILGSVGYASIQNGEFKHGSNANTYFFKDTSSEDVTAFKARLAAQYANGTPVIVLYPLATETTEQTTPHSLHTAQGTNVVSVTAEVSDISLTAEYKGVSS